MQSAIEYIQSKSWEFKKQSGQLVVKVCPFCRDEKFHFYMAPDGRWYCHKCNEKGNLLTLGKRLGEACQATIGPAFKKTACKTPPPDLADNYHRAIFKDSRALDYLKSRGLSNRSIEQFKLGLCQENGNGWITIPHFESGKLVNIKYRSLPPAAKSFKRIPNCRSVLFNGDALTEQDEIFITEGELDAISLIQNGVENVVSGTTGAGSFDPEWIDQLKTCKKIYLVYDPDESGQKGARSLAKRLGYNRCFNIELPDGQDVNDYFNSGKDIFDFQKLVNHSRRFDLPGVIPVDTAVDLLRRQISENKIESGIMTPWENVNRLTKGFRSGDLIILTAPPKIGKTSFALEICRPQFLSENPMLFYCLEMRPERLVNKVVQAQYRVAQPSIDELNKAAVEFAGRPLYFGYSFKKQPLEEVLNLIRDAIKRYGLQFVVFDNLHFLIRSTSNVNEELGQAVQGFKLLAEEMEIPIMVIAQPRKRDTSARDEIMRAEDVKYSNAVHADCDQMIILHRKRVASTTSDIESNSLLATNNAFEPITLVRVEAHRYGSGGETLLYFHGEYSRFDMVESSHILLTRESDQHRG